MKKLKTFTAYSCSWLLYASAVVTADDTDIYVNTASGGGAPYLMFMMDYRQDLSGPYCGTSGTLTKPTAESSAKPGGGGGSGCRVELDTDEGFVLLQYLDVVVNGVPGDADNNGEGDSAAAAAAAGDADFDGFRDTAVLMPDFEATKLQALVAVVGAVFDKFSGINVGLMMPNMDGGATVLRGYEMFQANDGNGAKQELLDILMALPMPSQGKDFHESQPKEMHYEWYRYINGGAVEFGDDTAANFLGTNTPAPDTSVWTVDGDGNADNYISPFASADPDDYECADLYSVYVTSGNETGSDSDLDSQIETDINSAADSSFESMMGFLATEDLLTGVTGDQTLKSWFVRVGSSDAKADDWAQAAGTYDQYMTVSGGGADLVNVQTTLEAAFIEALSVSTTFVAASVPVNVFNRVQTLDNFYIALFEAKTNTRWPGNLKKLKLADTDADGVFDDIIDARSATAFSDDDGRIRYEALTYWTDSSELPPADPDENEVSSRDGRAVERGGAGQKIPGLIAGSIGSVNGTGTRQLFYEPATAGAFVGFNADSTTATALQSDLGAASSSAAEALINWARGLDVDDEDGDGTRTEARDWILGDAIHSRPLAINYGATTGYSQTNPDIRLFMGTNDGYFHIFQNTDTSGNDSGEETFAFMPRELMDNVATLRANSTTEHVYGVDGEPVALVVDNDLDGTIETGDGDIVYVYVGLRRGGKTYYMIDASNPNSPRYLGKIDNTTSGFSELGMTFSKPKVTKVRYGGTTYDALIFAGGYDTNKDGSGGSDDGDDGYDTEGNAIYVVNARTGALIWKATYGGSTAAVSNSEYNHTLMRYSIPSEIMPLDSDRNGIVDRLYVGDTGSQVWRIDLPEGNNSSDTNHRRDNWDVTRLAYLGSGGSSGDRRFFHRPDVVQTKDAFGEYEAIVLSSGDRANPLEEDDANKLFYIKDRNITSGTPPSTTLSLSDLADVDNCTTCTSTDYRYGWRVDLDDDGEKGLSSPLVANGNVFFTSYVPNNGVSACAPAEGSGKLYILQSSNGEETFTGSAGMDVGPGIPASPIALGGDMLLLPGTGIGNVNVPGIIGNGKLVNLTGKSVWPLYWRSTGKDSL